MLVLPSAKQTRMHASLAPFQRVCRAVACKAQCLRSAQHLVIFSTQEGHDESRADAPLKHTCNTKCIRNMPVGRSHSKKVLSLVEYDIQVAAPPVRLTA